MSRRAFSSGSGGPATPRTLSLFQVCEALEGARQALLVRVIDASGEGLRHLGAVRVYRPGKMPTGAIVDQCLHTVLDPLVERQVHLPEPAHLLRLGHPAGGSLTLLVQPADALPPVAWDLLHARCPLVLRTSLVDGTLTTTAAVRLPDGVDAEPDLPSDARAAGHTYVERLDPTPRLALLGHGVLVEALADAAALLQWEPETPGSFSPGALQHLTKADVLLVVVNDPETRWRAAVAGVTSPAGYVGVVCPSQVLAGTTPSLRDGLHLLDAGDPQTTSPHQAALLLLDQVLLERHRTPQDDGRLLVFPGVS